jgi:hypothetical protein
MFEKVFVFGLAPKRLSVPDQTRQLQQLLLGGHDIFAYNDFVEQDLRNVVLLDTSDRDMLRAVFSYSRLEINLGWLVTVAWEPKVEAYVINHNI